MVCLQNIRGYRISCVLFLRSWLKTDLTFLNPSYQLIYIEDGEIKDNPHRHILHSLTKHGVNKNVIPLFFGVIEGFDVCERETTNTVTPNIL